MTVSAYAASAAAVRATDEANTVSRLAGLTIASMFPALFWASLLAAYVRVFDAPLTNASIAFVAIAIAMFLAAVCGPIMLRN